MLSLSVVCYSLAFLSTLTTSDVSTNNALFSFAFFELYVGGTPLHLFFRACFVLSGWCAGDASRSTPVTGFFCCILWSVSQAIYSTAEGHLSCLQFFFFYGNAALGILVPVRWSLVVFQRVFPICFPTSSFHRSISPLEADNICVDIVAVKCHLIVILCN